MNSPPIHILLIEDNPADAELLRWALDQAASDKFHVESADRLSTGLARLATGGVDAVLLDLSLPDAQGLDTFCRLHAQCHGVPVLVLSGLDDQAVAMQAVHMGAQDYLVKGQADGALLARSLRYAIQRQNLAKELEAAARSERLAHLQLKQAQSRLVQSEKLAALGQMVAGVAHEINNPLTWVQNNLWVLQRDLDGIHQVLRLYEQALPELEKSRPDLAKALAELIQRVDLAYTLENLPAMIARSQQGLTRIKQITKDFCDFGRTSAAELREVNLNAGIEVVLQLLADRAQSQGVRLQAQLTPLASMTCFPAKLNQAVLNMTLNALEATPAGGAITLRTASTPTEVEIHVVDTGRGIDPAIQDKIFDPFFTTKPTGQGSGLGLSLAHQVVSEHHGWIEVQSQPGEGAHFIIHLPLKPGAQKN